MKPTMKNCKRCGQPFTSRYIAIIKQTSTCCEDCSLRNMLDGLGMATPLALLDRHTHGTTSIHDEFQKSLRT